MIMIELLSTMKHLVLLCTFEFPSHNHIHLSEGHMLLAIWSSLESHLTLTFPRISGQVFYQPGGVMMQEAVFWPSHPSAFTEDVWIWIHSTPYLPSPHASYWIQIKNLFWKLCCIWSSTGTHQDIMSWEGDDVRVPLHSYHFPFITYALYSLSIPFQFLSLNALTLTT